MGTRHLQTVITKEGEKKINQYGQWDGYPSGQGIGILEYLRNANLEKYTQELRKIPEATEDHLKNVPDYNWKKEYPYLSRDCGSNIHKMIEDGLVLFVNKIDDDEANQWCEGFYTIDFKENKFTSSFYDVTHSFDLNNLPTNEEYLLLMDSEE